MNINEELTEARCKFCIFYIPDGKRSVWGRGEKTYCNIESVAELKEDDCLSFRPNPMFGICCYCEYHSNFNGPDYCRKDNQPNRRMVYGKPASIPPKSIGFDLYTCDSYVASYLWRPYILKSLMNGRCPANFDPDTWKFIKGGQLEGVLLKVEAMREGSREIAKEIAKREEEMRPKEYEQASLFD
ncbi:MAG: hypothetical protein AB7E31_14715 [Desulfitobacterium sp.]